MRVRGVPRHHNVGLRANCLTDSYNSQFTSHIAACFIGPQTITSIATYMKHNPHTQHHTYNEQMPLAYNDCVAAAYNRAHEHVYVLQCSTCQHMLNPSLRCQSKWFMEAVLGVCMSTAPRYPVHFAAGSTVLLRHTGSTNMLYMTQVACPE